MIISKTLSSGAFFPPELYVHMSSYLLEIHNSMGCRHAELTDLTVSSLSPQLPNPGAAHTQCCSLVFSGVTASPCDRWVWRERRTPHLPAAGWIWPKKGRREIQGRRRERAGLLCYSGVLELLSWQWLPLKPCLRSMVLFAASGPGNGLLPVTYPWVYESISISCCFL